MALHEVPSHQRAAVRQGTGASATAPVTQIPVQQPGPGQVLVKITWTGLCASDKSLIHDEWVDVGIGMLDDTKGVAGHEGAGHVVAVGAGMEAQWKVGDRAAITWIAKTCGECEFCRIGGADQVHCVAQRNSGFSWPGTFQEYVVAEGNHAVKIPDGVLDEEAGPIMCGGVTSYTACKR